MYAKLGVTILLFCFVGCGTTVSDSDELGDVPTETGLAGEVGTQHPAVVEAFSPDGSWAIVCQAREDTNGDGEYHVGAGHHGDPYGDALQAYLIMPDGPGEPIDAYVTADPLGNYIVFVRDGGLILLDIRSAVEVNLSQNGANSADDPNPFGPHRAASFDASGELLQYFRLRDDGEEILVVREVATGVEREVEPGGGLLWRAHLSADGTAIVAAMVVDDTDGSGGLEMPIIRTSLSDRHCRGPITTYSTSGLVADQPIFRVISLETAEVNDLPIDVELEPNLQGSIPFEDMSSTGFSLAPADSEDGIDIGPLHWVFFNHSGD